MTHPTVSSEIEKILQEVVDNAVQLSRVYGLKAKYVPDYSEALSKLEELIVEIRKTTRRHAELDMLVDVQIKLMQIGATEGEQRDEALKFVNNRIKALQKGDK